MDTLPRDALEARGKHLQRVAISDPNDAKNGRGYRPDLGDLDALDLDSSRRDPVVISVTKRPRYVSDPASHAREFDDHQADNLDAPAVVRRLKGLQARYQRLVDAGGWSAIPEGQRVAIGQRDDRLIAVRARLALTDDLESASGDATLDSELSAALGRFQQRVRLPVTGELDAATLHELNVPAHQRLMSIALSLSRTHELPHGNQEYVLVNIAGYTASYQLGDKLLWSGRTMVGTTATRTPQLVSAIDRMVFNPTWIVPNGIATRSVLPAVIDDPAYLARK
ncbi:MAG: peptidoglycan-binding protein, partial [Pseudomonadota bacterium]